MRGSSLHDPQLQTNPIKLYLYEHLMHADMEHAYWSVCWSGLALSRFLLFSISI